MSDVSMKGVQGVCGCLIIACADLSWSLLCSVYSISGTLLQMLDFFHRLPTNPSFEPFGGHADQFCCS